MITVHFHEVGRDKRSWQKQFQSVSEETIAREAKKSGALLSRDVWAELHDSGYTGVIVAGFRTVGTFTISP